jgi:hypothetical protein
MRDLVRTPEASMAMWKDLWDKIQGEPAQRRTSIAIAADHTDIEGTLSAPFEAGKHYFVVRLNEMFLAREREWASKYDPLVTVVSEFIYNGAEVSVPTAIGPSVLAKGGTATPVGRMAFVDTRVAGIHPYQGGRLTLTIILYKVQRSNHAKDLLDLIGIGAKALDFASALTPYLKIAGTLLSGIESMLRLDGTQPVIGQRIERDQDASGGIRPGYHALIDLPLKGVDETKFWVKRSQLCYGDSLASATPFEAADFMLYSVVRDELRSDLELLPFRADWARVRREAQTSVADAWTNAKINLASLIQVVRESPDLTADQAEKVVAEWKAEAVRLHKDAEQFATLKGAVDLDQRRRDAGRRDEALAVLDL